MNDQVSEIVKDILKTAEKYAKMIIDKSLNINDIKSLYLRDLVISNLETNGYDKYGNKIV